MAMKQLTLNINHRQRLEKKYYGSSSQASDKHELTATLHFTENIRVPTYLSNIVLPACLLPSQDKHPDRIIVT